MEATVKEKNLLARLNEHFVAMGYAHEPERKKAMDLLSTVGLPHSRTEEYRFTPIVRALEASAHFAVSPTPEVIDTFDLIPGMACNRVVFINGRFSPEHTQLLDQSILRLDRASLPAARDNQDPFDLLNLAFADEVIHLDIADHQQVSHPIAIVHYIESPGFVFANPRWSLTVGEGSKVAVIEHTILKPGSAWFTNKHSLLTVKPRGSVDFVTIQQALGEVQVNNSLVKLGDEAQALCYTCTLDGKLIRNNLTLVLDGERIDAHLHGLYLVTDNSLVDNHTVVDHRKPNSYSNELYKGVMDGQGKAVFNGKIFVRPDAQKTNAFQSNRNILLSESSNVHTKPQLEIWADDVKCSHGCTTGQLDEEALFYLRSRGIPKDAARGLLLNAFAAETLEGIHDETLRTFVESLIVHRLHPTQG